MTRPLSSFGLALIRTVLGAHATPALVDVLAERQRQVLVEGFTAQHDDSHGAGEIALAAACYAAHSACWQARQYTLREGGGGGALRHRLLSAQEFVGRMWPWSQASWRPADDRRNLVRAAALLLAEIERLDRRDDRGSLEALKP